MATGHHWMTILGGLICNCVCLLGSPSLMNPTTIVNLCGERFETWRPLVLQIKSNMSAPLKDCNVRFRASLDHRLMITILDQHIVTRSSKSVCNMFLILRDGPSNDSVPFSGDICGDFRQKKSDDGYVHSTRDGGILTTIAENAFFSFHVTEDVAVFDSNVLIVPFHEGKCTSEEYDCNNRRCVNEEVYCKHAYNMCGYKRLDRQGDNTLYGQGEYDCRSWFKNPTLIVLISIFMGIILWVVATCCCYKSRKKRHIRRRIRRQERTRVSIDRGEGINNPGAQIIPEIQLPAYEPSYPPPMYTTLPRSHGPPLEISGRSPDEERRGADNDPPPSYEEVNHTSDTTF